MWSDKAFGAYVLCWCREWPFQNQVREGCHSLLALPLLQCEGFCLNCCMFCRENLTLSENQYGWDKEANVIFVDQPLSVGFSVLDVSMLW